MCLFKWILFMFYDFLAEIYVSGFPIFSIKYILMISYLILIILFYRFVDDTQGTKWYYVDILISDLILKTSCDGKCIVCVYSQTSIYWNTYSAIRISEEIFHEIVKYLLQPHFISIDWLFIFHLLYNSSLIAKEKRLQPLSGSLFRDDMSHKILLHVEDFY